MSSAAACAGSAGAFTSATVLGADEPVAGSGWRKLALLGTSFGSFTGPGMRYRVYGKRDNFPAAQSGEWEMDAVSFGGTTYFKLDPYAYITEHMVGWYLQPDVNTQAYLPITIVDPQQHIVTVAGDYEVIGTEGTRWRIYAPPGTERIGKAAGMLDRWVAAESSRCLYAAYRYESPLAGMQDWTTTTPAAVGRQSGENFAGQYYTLHRHYDPYLMRFTSPDPAAAPFWNLGAYAGNSPASAYDPDGLSEASEGLGNWMRQQGQESIDEMRANGEDTRAGVNEGIRSFLSGMADVGSAVLFGGYDASNWAVNGEEMFLTKMALGINKRMEARAETINNSDGSTAEKRYAFVALTLGDLTGSTKIFVEGGAGIDSVTGQPLTEEQSAAAVTEGAFTVLMLSSAARTRSLAAEGPKCFVAGTQILAADEYGSTTATNIEDVEVGDWVWSRNEETGEECSKPVTRLFRNQTDTLVHLTYTTGSGQATLTGTEEHPFWSLTRNSWVGMGELQVGEQMLLAGQTGTTATVTATRTEQLSQSVTVYNFEVADWHTYHVGTPETGWVYVHNLCNRGAVNKLKALRKEARTEGTALNRLVSNQRRTAVAEAWSAERALLRAGEQGTVEWNAFQKLQLRVFGKVRGFQGHHINSVAGSPYMASWKSNVTFMNRTEHLAAHLGKWQTRTYGKLHEVYGGSLR